MIKDERTNWLETALEGQNFTRRGKAFFRVHGDGILQTVKVEYEPHNFGVVPSMHTLNIGLQSMYGELLKQWFTSSGCIPRYDVSNVLGVRWSTVTAEEQVEQLREYGIPWLNSITTQQKHLEGIRYLETSWGGRMYLNNDELITPYMMLGDYESAAQVISAILEQHASGYTWDKRWQTYEQHLKSCQRLEEEDRPLKEKLNWLQTNDHETIQKYLMENYKRNCELAKFCMKAKKA